MRYTHSYPLFLPLNEKGWLSACQPLPYKRRTNGGRLLVEEEEQEKGSYLSRRKGLEYLRKARQKQLPQGLHGSSLGILGQILHLNTGNDLGIVVAVTRILPIDRALDLNQNKAKQKLYNDKHSYSYRVAADEGNRSYSNDKLVIISGTVVTTDRTQAPFAARLHGRFRITYEPNNTVNYDVHFCLVTTRRVLTSGYCVLPLHDLRDYWDNSTYVDVYLGDLQITAKNEVGEVKITAKSWRAHPQYRDLNDFDVGLLFLDTAAATLSPQVKLIELPSLTYTIGSGPVDVTAYGWGRSTLGNYSGICTHCLHTSFIP
jgi:hypothetical protein